MLLLLFRTVAVDGKHAERPLNRDEAAKPTVAALQLLAGEAVHHIAHAGSAVTMEMHTEHAKLGKLGDDLLWERRPLVVLGDNWEEALVDEPPDRRTD